MYKLGILGYGKMGDAIINGIITSGKYKRNDICVYDLDQAKLNNLKKLGFNIAQNENDVWENADIFLFAIKPQNFPDTLEKLKKVKRKPNIVISIAASITTDYLKDNLGENKYFRVMPSLTASIGKSVSLLAPTSNILPQELAEVMSIFNSIGITYLVLEEDINLLTPFNGCMPAFVYYIINSYLKAGMKYNINNSKRDDILKEVIIKSFKYSLEMIENSEISLEEMIGNVCSPGGVTIEGMKTLMQYNVDDIIAESINKCITKGKLLEDKIMKK